MRIAVVTHGQASSPFWAVVRNGVEAAARQMDVLVSYRAPDVYSVERMQELIDQAIGSRPDGLVVSIPEPGLGVVIRRAVAGRDPGRLASTRAATSSGASACSRTSASRRRAGLLAGRRLARGGVRRALCVNQEIGNQGLDAALPRAGAGDAAQVGGKSTVMRHRRPEPRSTPKRGSPTRSRRRRPTAC